MTAPPLPDGLVAVVKKDCPTCVLVAPVLEDLASRADLTVITQDDAGFPADAPWVVHDADLALSWHHDIETVPTLLKVTDGSAVETTVGWSRDQWEAFTGVDGLGADLPDMRPGCGSLSVDPTLTDELAVRFSGSTLHSRRIEIADLEDEWEAMWDRGWSDGLPVVPPTEARVLRMLEGTTRAPDDIVAVVPPDLVECTVEKVAVNAVMAGCKPEYLPVVLAAVEAACTDEFNMHGLLATTMPVGPVMIVNGPIRNEIGMNAGLNLLGQGNRANSTIGRALQLTIRNVGGGKPGGVDRATQGNPSKYGLCFAEDEEGTPWDTFAESRGFASDVSTVTLFPGEGPRLLFDQKSRSAESLTKHFAQMLMSYASPRMIMQFETIVVISPEHMARYRDAGWDRARFLEELNGHLTVKGADVISGADGIEEGMPDFIADMELSKYPPGGIHVVHGGSGAGLFSSAIGGWVTGEMGSVTVTKEITR
ncbi:MAG: thioredoxin family protein [Acidimicrobiales bacterium]|nr:thioredoxin family protein [Acidimicrobiales bacterium]